MPFSIPSRRNILISIIIISIIFMLTIAGWFMLRPVPLIAQGEIEATQVKVASKIAGRVKSIHVKEGEFVEQGKLLISLDSPEIEAKLRQAEAAQKMADAQRAKAYSGTRKEQIESAKNLWLKAQAGTELAKKTLDRVQSLYAEGVLSEQKLDEAKAQYKTAVTTEDAAKASYNMAVAGAQLEDKEAARALFDQASSAVSEVQVYLGETSLHAPIGSEVAEIIPSLGELVSPGYPVITLIDLNDIWITFNLREDMLADIKMGSVMNVIIPALGNQEVKIKINYISVQGDFATWRATRTSGDFDMKTFEVRGVPVNQVEGLRPGMSVLANWNEVKKLNADNDESDN